jgi:hypothetical protein
MSINQLLLESLKQAKLCLDLGEKEDIELGKTIESLIQQLEK